MPIRSIPIEKGYKLVLCFYIFSNDSELAASSRWPTHPPFYGSRLCIGRSKVTIIVIININIHILRDNLILTKIKSDQIKKTYFKG